MQRFRNLHTQRTMRSLQVQDAVESVISLDCNGVVLLWNYATEQITGIPEADALGCNIADLSVPGTLAASLMRYIREKEPILPEISLPNGEKAEAFAFQSSPEPQYTFILRVREERLPALQAASLSPQDVERTGMLQELTQSIQQEMDLSRVLQWTANRIGQMLHADRCLLIEYDSFTETFFPVEYEYRRSPEVASMLGRDNVPLLRSRRGYCEAWSVNNVAEAPELTGDERAELQADGVKSLLHVPIQVKNELLGVLRVVRLEEPQVWTERAVRLAKDAAGQVAVALREARIMQNLAQSLDALQRSEAKFRRVVESNMVGFMFFDEERRIFDANEAFLNLLGYTPEQVEQGLLSWHSIMADEPLEEHRAYFHRHGIHPPFELQLVRADGTTIEVLLGAAVLERNPFTGVGFVIDITARKSAEKALSSSEARFRRIMDSNMLGIFYPDLNGGVQDANDYFLNMLGYTREEMETGQISWRDLTPLQWQAQDKAAVETVLKDGIVQPFEKQYLTKDGRVIDVLLGCAVMEPGDKADGVAFVLDLTERKRAERALLDNERKFRAVFDTALELMVLKDDEGRYLDVNRALCEFAGLPREEILGKTMQEVFTQDKEMAGSWERAVREGHVSSGEYTCHTVNGRERILEFNVIPNIVPGCHLTMARDITERKAQERALRESEERYRIVLEGSQDGVWDMDLRHQGVHYWNDRFFEIIGETRQSFTPTTEAFWSRVHPEDLPRFLASYNAHLGHNLLFEVDIRLRHSSGEYRHCFCRGHAIRDDHGHPIRMAGLITDITGRSQTEKALRESEARFRTMADGAPMLIWTCNVDGHLDYYNKTWLAYTGLSLEDQLVLGWEKFVHPDDLGRVDSLFRESRKEAKAYHIEYRLRRYDGEYRWFYETTNPHFGIDGKFAGYTGLCVDVTERRSNEQALVAAKNKAEAAEERYRLALDSINNAIWDQDLQTNRIYWNERLVDMLGLRDTQVLDQALFLDLLHPEDRDRYMEKLHAHLERGERFEIVYRMRHANGEYHDFYSRGQVLRDAYGVPIRLTGVTMDITHIRKRA